MAKHHIVQDKYLTQWRKTNTENQLNIYVISENKYIERGPGWKGFWRDDFNVLNDDQKKSYLPENVTAIVDTKGIDAIKKIDIFNQNQMSGEDRSALAFYVVLQYIRTPRHREEIDKMAQATIQYFMRKDISSPEKITISKDEILNHHAKNQREKEAMEKIKKMSDEEIKKQLFETIHNDNSIAGLTNTGHSKSILKVDQLAKDLFETQWMFLVAPNGSTFITSDNPCFTISPIKIMNGLLSPQSTVIFPLRPDLCIYIKPGMKSKTEYYMKLDDRQVQNINKLILENSYQCVVAKNKVQLENLTRNFDYKNHRKSRDIVVSEKGDYTMFSIE